MWLYCEKYYAIISLNSHLGDMKMKKNNVDNLAVFSDVISSLVLKATGDVEGLEIINSKTESKRAGKNKSIVVKFLPNDKVTLDVSVAIKYGYVVPDVVSLAQEKIISAVEGATKYKVQSVNVQVVSVIVQ